MGIWHTEYLIDRTVQLGRVAVRLSWRSRKSAMGRFGGGWDWKLGFQVGGSTLLISLLVAELRVQLEKRV